MKFRDAFWNYFEGWVVESPINTPDDPSESRDKTAARRKPQPFEFARYNDGTPILTMTEADGTPMLPARRMDIFRQYLHAHYSMSICHRCGNSYLFCSF